MSNNLLWRLFPPVSPSPSGLVTAGAFLLADVLAPDQQSFVEKHLGGKTESLSFAMCVVRINR
jgi:hypothetical protein